MPQLFHKIILTSLLTLTLLACIDADWIGPRTKQDCLADAPSSGTQSPCQRPIAENIIGTWRFTSNMVGTHVGLIDGKDTVRGTITFTAERTVIDPDSLFANSVDGGRTRVMKKTYVPDAPSRNPALYSGTVFEVNLINKLGYTRETGLYTIYRNECDRIHMIQWLSGDRGYNAAGFVLTRQK